MRREKEETESAKDWKILLVDGLFPHLAPNTNPYGVALLAYQNSAATNPDILPIVVSAAKNT